MSSSKKKTVLSLTVNGEQHDILIYPHLTLLEVLREELELTGAKEGCGEGVCGSCTVLMDGRPIRSCLTLALEAEGHEIETIEGLGEGLAGGGDTHPVQQAFIDHGAIQCGFCTPGMILTAKALLDENPSPTEDQVREAIAANICRCTGYEKIVQAVMAVGNDGEAQDG